jgi:hypothetical protein
VDYYGKKDNVQPTSTVTFHPVIRRQGVFGNYKLFSKVDFLGGWVHSNDGWLAPDGSSASFIGNDYYGAVDYYILQGLAVSGLKSASAPAESASFGMTVARSGTHGASC